VLNHKGTGFVLTGLNYTIKDSCICAMGLKSTWVLSLCGTEKRKVIYG